MTIWFSSDLHLYHTNIIKYGNRPFDNAKQMTEALRTYHNELVRPSDHWYNLGDLTMLRGNRFGPGVIEEMKKWHGHKRLILGNHDHLPLKVYSEIFEKIVGTGRWMENFWFSHFPVHPNCMGGADACIHGHIHQNPAPPPVIQIDKNQRMSYKPYVNVSVEAINYRPVSLEQLKTMVGKAKGEYAGVSVGPEVH